MKKIFNCLYYVIEHKAFLRFLAEQDIEIRVPTSLIDL